MGSLYTEVSILADGSLAEHLVGILSQLGFEGFWEEADCLKCYMSSERWTPALEIEVEETIVRISRSSKSPTPAISVRMLENMDWNEEWKKTLAPLQVSPRIIVTPSWHTVTPRGDVVLVIDPKMAFGTGYHETTRLVLRLLEKHTRKGMSVLDVGTGTGILAIASVKLGASSAVGLDVDAWACSNALENVLQNNVADAVRIENSELTSYPHEVFDIIAANLQKDLIEQLLEEMILRLASGGLLLLSGLLMIDRAAITGRLHRASFRIVDEIAENEWIALAAMSG